MNVEREIEEIVEEMGDDEGRVRLYVRMLPADDREELSRALLGHDRGNADVQTAAITAALVRRARGER